MGLGGRSSARFCRAVLSFDVIRVFGPPRVMGPVGLMLPFGQFSVTSLVAGVIA